jgi:peptidoglycan/LPS O-acetylase OafA/YrhL
MRGIAAIAVVMFHADIYFHGLYPRSAYLAVDLFFCLSGFVIAHAYDNRLAVGLTPAEFMRIRILRLYPLYIAGSALTITAVAAALFVKHDASQWTVHDFEIAVPAALLMLPAPFFQNIFSLNIPAWSLFYELVANAVYATSLFSVAWLTRLVVGLATGGIIVQILLFGHIDQGTLWPSTFWALARVFFSFPLGIMLYRLHRTMRPIAVPSPLLLGVLVVALYVPLSGVGRMLFDTIFVLFASPALVLLGSLSAPSGPSLRKFYRFLGLISYPIYVIHFPVIMILNSWDRRHGNVALHHALMGPMLVLGLIAISWVAGHADARFRRAVTKGRTAFIRA